MTVEKFLLLSKSILCLSIATTVLIVVPYIINSQLTSIRNDARIELESYKTSTISLVNTRFDSLQTFATGLFDKTNTRIGSLENTTFQLAKDIRVDSLSELENIRSDSFGQIKNLNSNLNGQFTTLNETLSSNVGRLTDTYVNLPSAIGSRFDRQTDCVHNGLCWQNLTTDTLSNFRYTGRDVSSTMKIFSDGYPHIQAQFDATVTNFALITEHINKLTTPKWYDRLFGYALNGAILYRNLNPITNLTLSGAQAASSLK